MQNCSKCNNTGVIDAGNEIIPCECPNAKNGPFSEEELWNHFAGRGKIPDWLSKTNLEENWHFISTRCKGERCRMCREPATHKIGEEIPSDDPNGPFRHEFTAYICCKCFFMIMGPAVFCQKS